MIRRFREVSRVFLCWDPVDFRKNITGLAGIVQYIFDEDLYSGSLFVFTNRSKNAIKVLKWDTDGFILYHKKRSKGKFAWPSKVNAEKGTVDITQKDLDRLLSGLEMEKFIPKKSFVIA